MSFNNIRIVLVETTHSGNIGSTARAMMTMGLNRLYLVNPRSFPAQQAYDLAAGADEILHRAVITSSLKQALEGTHLVVGTSARPRTLQLPGLLPAECATLISEQNDATEIAVVFGREHAGLTNDELLCCQYHVQIPSHPQFSSLNLAQAVQIIAYEIRMKLCYETSAVIPGLSTEAIALKPKSQLTLASHEEIEQFYTHLSDVLIDIDF